MKFLGLIVLLLTGCGAVNGFEGRKGEWGRDIRYTGKTGLPWEIRVGGLFDVWGACGFGNSGCVYPGLRYGYFTDNAYVAAIECGWIDALEEGGYGKEHVARLLAKDAVLNLFAPNLLLSLVSGPARAKPCGDDFPVKFSKLAPQTVALPNLAQWRALNEMEQEEWITEQKWRDGYYARTGHKFLYTGGPVDKRF